MRRHLTFANVMAGFAVFMVLGGTAYAAGALRKNSVRSAHIKNGQVKRGDVARSSITSVHIKNGSLLLKDFAAAQIPRGERGPAGPPGPQGPAGTVDTSDFFTKSQSDERFLAAGGKAADADRLDGRDVEALLQLQPGAAQEPAAAPDGTPMLWLRMRSELADGTRSPADLKVLNDGGFLAGGKLGWGKIPAQGPGERMMWYPYKGAFRAGTPGDAPGDAWNDANVGFYSWAGGHATRATSFGSFAFGDDAAATSTAAVALGSSSIASGTASLAAGASGRAQGFGSTAIGYANRASGQASVAMGYRVGALGNYSTALGQRAATAACPATPSCDLDAVATVYPGSFIWADASSGNYFSGSAANQFSIRAAGGVRMFTNPGLSTGASLAPNSGSWSSLSDRAAKRDVARVDEHTILERLADVPVRSWQYKGQRGVRHIGPMAQDFRRAFGLGVDERHIDTVDADGVALASIQALHRMSLRQARQLDRQAARIRDLERRLARRGAR